MNPLLPAPADAALFATAVFLLNLTPGVDTLLTVSRTLQGGARAGLAAALGVAGGCVLHTLAAAFGLAALLALHPQAFQALQWAGAAYLMWLGIGLLRQAWRGAPPTGVPATAARAWSDDFRSGLLTNLLNPKVALFILAFLPQFVPAGTPSRTASFLLLGAWFVGQGLVYLLALVAALLALATSMATRGPRRTPPALPRVLQALGGALFVALALRLLRSRPDAA